MMKMLKIKNGSSMKIRKWKNKDQGGNRKGRPPWNFGSMEQSPHGKWMGQKEAVK